MGLGCIQGWIRMGLAGVDFLVGSGWVKVGLGPVVGSVGSE